MCLLLRMLESSKTQTLIINYLYKRFDKMSTEEVTIPEAREDTQPREISMSKKQRKRFLKSQRIKEKKPQWRY